MKLFEIISASDKRTRVKLHALKRKKKNPIESKTTSLNSFIDVFGGMAGYDSTSQAGTVNPDTN